jgi:hypothetical protein
MSFFLQVWTFLDEEDCLFHPSRFSEANWRSHKWTRVNSRALPSDDGRCAGLADDSGGSRLADFNGTGISGTSAAEE